MWWLRHYTTNTRDVLFLFGICLLVGLHYTMLAVGGWFALYFLWMLFDTSLYLFIGFVCLCYLCLISYFYAFNHD